MSGASVERGYVKKITQEGIRVESITRPGIVTPPMELLEVMEDPQPGDMVYYYMFSDGKCRILAVKPQQGGGGVTEHGKLTGREANDQHPIRAITGLQQKLETIPTKVSQLENDEGYAKEDEVPDKVSDLENDSGFITPNDVKNGLADIDRAAFGTDDAEEKQLKIPADWDFFHGADRTVPMLNAYSVDLNTAIAPGFYQWGNSSANSPEANSYGVCIAYTSDGKPYNGANNWLYQIAISTNSVRRIYLRYKINADNFSAWNRFDSAYDHDPLQYTFSQSWMHATGPLGDYPTISIPKPDWANNALVELSNVQLYIDSVGWREVYVLDYFLNAGYLKIRLSPGDYSNKGTLLASVTGRITFVS